jgi:hypothetical protein
MGDTTLAERLTPHDLLSIFALRNYLNMSPEEREEQKREEQFSKWAANLPQGPWVPKVGNMGETVRK